MLSTTLEKVEWENSKLVHKVIPEEIEKMKQKPGHDMVIFRSGTIVQAFANIGLIDEYRLMVNPVILDNRQAFI